MFKYADGAFNKQAWCFPLSMSAKIDNSSVYPSIDFEQHSLITMHHHSYPHYLVKWSIQDWKVQIQWSRQDPCMWTYSPL